VGRPTLPRTTLSCSIVNMWDRELERLLAAEVEVSGRLAWPPPTPTHAASCLRPAGSHAQLSGHARRGCRVKFTQGVRAVLETRF